MKRVFGLLFLSLIANMLMGQNGLKQVDYTKEPKNTCRHVTLGSGFEKSGMVQYVARPKILESKWSGGQLTIKIFVVSDCCPPDYLGYMVHSDTLKLYYGDKMSISDKHGRPKEVQICCGFNGCCYEFEYKIKKLKHKNYLVVTSNVLGIGLIKPFPIGYTDSEYKSVHYSSECRSFDVCLDDKIADALSYYKRLGPLYDSLIDLHKQENAGERKMVDQLKKVWIKYFDCREAIYDEFIKSKVDREVYSSKLAEFESQVEHELKLLEPKLDITSKYLQGGAIAERIIDVKEK